MEKYRVNRNGTRMQIHQVVARVVIGSEVGLKHYEPQDLHQKNRRYQRNVERQAELLIQENRAVIGKAEELKTSLAISFSTFRSIQEEKQMDMSMNTALSWKSILAGISRKLKASITRTVSRMITDYRTLSLCNIESIKAVLNVPIVERSF